MKRIHTKEVASCVGEKVLVAGFVQVTRNQGKIGFIILRDISGEIQVVVIKQELISILTTITNESVVEIVGIVKEDKQAPNGVEIEMESIEILSHAEPELPIPIIIKTGEETELPKRLDWRFVDLRKPENTLIFKVWTFMEQAFREYWTSNEYIEIHSPKLMSSPSESGAELFEVKYFDRVAYLAQSPQFYKQMGMASGFEKVFEVGPVFRANPSFTSRHDTEFTGYDCEISYVKSHHDVMEEEAKALQFMLSKVSEKYVTEIEKFFDRKVVVPTLPFPKVTMKEAKEILKNLEVPSTEDGDLSPEEERALSKYILDTQGHEFVFVTDYPAYVRAFYHMRHDDDDTLTKSFDLLWNGIEITTGAQREHRYEKLCKQVKEKGLHLEPIQNYLNFFRYGCPPHGGFGLSPTRLLMKLLNVQNVREVTYVYRGPKRLDP